MSEQEAIARLEADLEAKERELERLKALTFGQGTQIPDVEAQIQRAEEELEEARTRYEDAMNA